MQTSITHPAYLKKGDKIGIITPSGSVDPIFIDGAVKWINRCGYEAIVAPHAKGQHGRFCGTIEERLADIQMMFDRDDIKAILCSRGGYGAVQLLDSIEMDGFIKHPKWLIGYSDITALHQLIAQHNIASLHAPMARHMTEDPTNDASLHLIWMLKGKSLDYPIIENHSLNIKGEYEGQLIGGNLAVFASLMGSKYTNIPEGSILFLEDIAERAYAIDRMMWNLKVGGIFNRISGLIIGQFTDCNEDAGMYDDIYTSIRKMIEAYNIPIAFNFPVGHVADNYPLMHGANHKLVVGAENVILKLI